MYSDTHFHFQCLAEKYGVSWGASLLETMALRNCFFALDIGTSYYDLLPRMEYVKESLDLASSGSSRDRIRNMIYFSAGIWPDEESIRKRAERLSYLESQIKEADRETSLFPGKLIAIGECGLDHHWNPTGEDKRSGDGWKDSFFDAERELFLSQISLAKKLSLPVIVHSRDAFEGTLSCIVESGYDRGIIHCFSYGIDESRAFLDRGYYIAVGGGLTYTKKRLMEQMKELVRFIPSDRLLLETDAPYLAPVPCRGQINTPLLIAHTYKFIADIRGISEESLSLSVDENCRTLFKL